MGYTVDLSRFTEAHRDSFPRALAEIRSGRKTSHWMWYIFPQVLGLGRSPTAQFYAIKTLEETKAFLVDPYLGHNLKTICDALLSLETSNPAQIFGSPDDLKLRSCMTLFSLISAPDSVFHRVLDKFFQGMPDTRTLFILGMGAAKPEE